MPRGKADDPMLKTSRLMLCLLEAASGCRETHVDSWFLLYTSTDYESSLNRFENGAAPTEQSQLARVFGVRSSWSAISVDGRVSNASCCTVRWFQRRSPYAIMRFRPPARLRESIVHDGSRETLITPIPLELAAGRFAGSLTTSQGRGRDFRGFSEACSKVCQMSRSGEMDQFDSPQMRFLSEPARDVPGESGLSPRKTVRSEFRTSCRLLAGECAGFR